MKWPIKPIAQKGAARMQSTFAWLPVRVEGDQVVWLEDYIVHQRYTVVFGYYGLPYLEWTTIKREAFRKEQIK